MDVRLSPEQEALRDSVAQVVDDLGPHAVGALDDEARTAKLEAAVAASGWRELRGTADGGEPLASAVEVAIVAEQLGRGLADAAFVGPTLAVELRRLVGAPDGEALETVAFAPGLVEPICVARDETVTDGLAVDGAGASSALVLTPATTGHDLATVELAGASGAAPLDPVDLTRTVAPVTPQVPARLDGQARSLSDDDLLRWTALGLATTSADLVGAMAGAVRLARDYAAERRQFGTPVGSFQAVQHLLADAHVATEGSRSATLQAAWAVDALPPAEALAAAAGAKAYCARAARTVCETAIQVHGGIGNTWECLAHVYLRRALLSSDVLGGTGPNLARALAHHGLAPTPGGHHGLR